MVKGTEKRVIRVKCEPGGRIEEAFLIMKPGWESDAREDIVDEAERLLFNAESGAKKKKRINPLLPVLIISIAVAVIAYFVLR